jgi:hypothetical protein
LKKLVNKITGYLKEFGKLTPLALATSVLPIIGGSLLLTVAYPLAFWLRENWQLGAVVF